MDADTENPVSVADQDRERLTTKRPIPAAAGVGLRSPHLEAFATGTPDTPWVEIHSENFISIGGLTRHRLEQVRAHYPISCHGVGLSLGSAEGLDAEHLKKLKALFDWVEPGLVSEHVSWSTVGGTYLNDLLPLPYTEDALAVICRNIDHAQEVFGRRMLVENPSAYVTFAASTLSEEDFLSEIVARTGCGLLLDVNNIVVSAANNGFDAQAYLEGLPADAVGEIHVAGHLEETLEDQTVLIDDHGSAVPDEVWALYDTALTKTGAVPTLMEWDTNVPDLPVLLAEAAKAQERLNRLSPEVAHVA